MRRSVCRTFGTSDEPLTPTLAAKISESSKPDYGTKVA
jgi:hypothetical protein